MGLLLKAKYKTNLSIIAQAESLLLPGRKIDHTTIINSQKTFEDQILPNYPTLVGLIYKVVFGKSFITNEEIKEAIL